MNGWRYARKPSVSEQRARALRERRQLERTMAEVGRRPAPVVIEGRLIARSFWGKAWCQNLESYRDYAYRLPRGRSYVRHGAVLDLVVGAGSIQARVGGSGPRPYEVGVRIAPLSAAHWGRIQAQCAGEIGSLIELLEGRLSDRVMGIVADRTQGLFPRPDEIQMHCTCPDQATLCKHVAAALYGVGARLDAQPELLFALRQVDHLELMAQATVAQPPRAPRRRTIAEEDLARVFGIELAHSAPGKPARRKRSAGESAVRAPSQPAREVGRAAGRPVAGKTRRTKSAPRA